MEKIPNALCKKCCVHLAVFVWCAVLSAGVTACNLEENPENVAEETDGNTSETGDDDGGTNAEDNETGNEDAGISDDNSETGDDDGETGDDESPTDDDPQPFTVDLTNAICPDLTQIGLDVAGDENACAEQCESDPDCDLWQWCPGGPCPNYDGNSINKRIGQCLVSTSGSSRAMCIPVGNSTNVRWIGKARKGSGRVPEKTTPVTTRRGFSGFLDVKLDNGSVIASCTDATALKRDKGWYYNWMTRTSRAKTGVPNEVDYCRNVEKLWGAGPNVNRYNLQDGAQMGGEFVPMIIGITSANSVLDNIEHFRAEWNRANVHYLLGYNEPDPAPNHPHSCDPYDGAVAWVDVQKVANSFNPSLILVSPAPASEDFDENGKSEWLDAFFKHCRDDVPECDPDRIEIIAFHDYQRNDEELTREKLETKINNIAAHYGGKKLWLTEFSGGRLGSKNENWGNRAPTREEQDAYMKEVLPMLESHPSIFRYVWFNSRNGSSHFGPTSLLVSEESDPIPTSTGEIYRDWPE